MALLHDIRQYGRKNRILDGADDSELAYEKVLPAVIAFSKVIREETEQVRVAIVLPPGKAGLIANLAVIFTGEIPVNLNSTAGPEAIRSCIRQAGVDRFITADPFVRKISSFPRRPNRDLIFIERVLPTLKKKIVTWVLISKISPTSVLGALLELNKRKGDDEATLLFTSGSSGEPKGVVLTHRSDSVFLPPRPCVRGSSTLGCMPLVHSFDCTVTLWFPVIEGVDLITYPIPLETKRLAELIALHQIKVLFSTIAGSALKQECIDLRYKLLDEGLPSLWCPKQIIAVNEIPVLASGKLDIKGCESVSKRLGW